MTLALLLSLLLTPALAADEAPPAEETEAVAVVDPADTWDLSHVFPTLEDWDQAVTEAETEIAAIEGYRGTLAVPAQLAECLERIDALSLALARIDTYAFNHSSEDNRDPDWRASAQRAGLLWAGFGEAVSWVDPEILAIGEKKIEKAMSKEDRLAPFAYSLRSTLRRGAHTLPPAQEELLAATASMRAGPSQIYGVLFNAEVPWPTITLSDGTEVTLDTAGYAAHRASPVREDRIAVYEAYYGTLADYQGTAGATLGVGVQGHWFMAKARGYDTCLAAALDREFLPPAVYRTLIERTNANLPTLHRYLELRARMLGLDDLAYHDLYPALVDVEMEFPIARGKELAIASAAPLGDEYQGILRKGFEERWMDVYPQPGKSPGAYMDGGSYDVHPFVLMNYSGDYESVSTLAHEWGHAAHSSLTNTTQPHPTADYATFIAEIASTSAEALLLDHMLEEAKTDDERMLYLGAALESLRTTFFRQAMFAEFELAVHEMAERDEPITGEGLSEMYLELVRRYHGHDEGITTVDELHAVEWVFVRHFYYNFYVWQYATSISAGSLLSEDVLTGKEGAVDRYLTLLRAGGSDDPYLLLKEAGVDMATPEPYDALARRMEAIMDEIETILDRQEGGAEPTGE